MKAFRIAKEKYIKDLSGTGAKLYGGRWNPKGLPLLYTSENKSLAALEILVHLDRDTIPDDLKIISLTIPDELIISFDEKKFQKILRSENSISEFKQEGQKWLSSKKSLALKTSSVLITGEHNILINPEHPDFKKIKIGKVESFIFDNRFFR
jgi:RES domain-containing protein